MISIAPLRPQQDSLFMSARIALSALFVLSLLLMAAAYVNVPF
jgi:hypothetical protein